MAGIAHVDPVAAPHGDSTREERNPRAAAEFGAAVTHRDLVREKMRVDPAAKADKRRAADKAREDDARPDAREQRLAMEREAYAQGKRTGFIVDIEV